MSTGSANAVSPMTTKQPHATQIGAGVSTLEKVAMKGELRDARRPVAMRRPLPSPRFSTLSAWGVYLGKDGCQQSRHSRHRERKRGREGESTATKGRDRELTSI